MALSMLLDHALQMNIIAIFGTMYQEARGSQEAGLGSLGSGSLASRKTTDSYFSLLPIFLGSCFLRKQEEAFPGSFDPKHDFPLPMSKNDFFFFFLQIKKKKKAPLCLKDDGVLQSNLAGHFGIHFANQNFDVFSVQFEEQTRGPLSSTLQIKIATPLASTLQSKLAGLWHSLCKSKLRRL